MLKTRVFSFIAEFSGWMDLVPVGVHSYKIRTERIYDEYGNIYQDLDLGTKRYLRDTMSCSVSTTHGQRYPLDSLELAIMLSFQSPYRLHVHFGTLKLSRKAEFRFFTPILLVQKDKLVIGCPNGNFKMRWKRFDYSLTSRFSYKGCPRTLKKRKITVMQS